MKSLHIVWGEEANRIIADVFRSRVKGLGFVDKERQHIDSVRWNFGDEGK